MDEHFDAIIIGAGMSGLAAGIRLAMFDKNVLILEEIINSSIDNESDDNIFNSLDKNDSLIDLYV